MLTSGAKDTTVTDSTETGHSSFYNGLEKALLADGKQFISASDIEGRVKAEYQKKYPDPILHSLDTTLKGEFVFIHKSVVDAQGRVLESAPNPDQAHDGAGGQRDGPTISNKKRDVKK